ncbi:MAG: NUDIX domain-containing protein [Candidatus Pacebacteria bacterium]|nr:NUDIX domain-containing protein [Candidatus Paceibacterota bacterium]
MAGKAGEDFVGISIVFYCHDGRGNFIMNKRGKNCRDEQGRWEIGGGALDVGMTVEDALRKEVKEEYGTTILSFEFLGYRDVHREFDNKKTHWITLDFKVLVDPVQVKNAEPHKMDAVEWFTFDTLPNPRHSQFKYFMAKYKEVLTLPHQK